MCCNRAAFDHSLGHLSSSGGGFTFGGDSAGCYASAQETSIQTPLMNSEVAELRAQISELRQDLESLSGEVTRLRRLVARGLAEGTGSRASSEFDQGSDLAYSFVSSPVTAIGQESRSGVEAGVVECAGDRAVLNWTQREEIAEGVGRFLQRSLRGDHRAGSGSDSNPLASRIWIVCRSITGEVYNPVRVFTTWSSAKALVKRGASAGDAVFVGLPSQREGKIAVASAGLSWPEHLER